MSVKIPRSSLTDETVKTIRSLLNISPKTPEIFNKNNFVKPEPKPPIQFYRVQDNFVYLPFQFANTLFKTICNYNNVYTPHCFKFNGTLLDYQATDMKTACMHLTNFCSTTLNFSTGAGKTICSCFLSTAVSPQLLTMVIINNTSLLESWKKSFTETTNAKIWSVGEEEMPEAFDVIICMDTRVEKIPAKIINDVGFLIIDEIDRLMTPSRVTPLLSASPKYIIGLTATLDMRTDGLDSMIHCLLGNHKIERIIEKNITLYKCNTLYTPPIERTSRGTKWDVVIKWLSINDDRNNMIIDWCLRHHTHKILIMCNLKEHTKTLCDKILAMQQLAIAGKIDNPLYSKDPKDYTADFYCGTKKSYNACRILIGGIKKIGVGFDDASSSGFDGVRINMLVMANSIKDASLIVQVLGRIRDPNPVIAYFVDDNKTIKSHFTVSKEFVESRNGKVISLKEHEVKNIVIQKLESDEKKDDDVTNKNSEIKINIK
jgi:superfamily II DNA or RNA helicase